MSLARPYIRCFACSFQEPCIRISQIPDEEIYQIPSGWVADPTKNLVLEIKEDGAWNYEYTDKIIQLGKCPKCLGEI